MKTKNSYTGFKTFYPDYVYLSDTAAEYLATLSLDIVGIDFISVKGMVETSNKAHTTLLSKNILILEGIDLNSVAEGTYFFSGLPLKITDTDGAPARVVIIDNL
jgi:arylformamidase